MADAPILVHRFSVTIEAGASRRPPQELPLIEVILPEVLADRAAARRAKPTYTNLVLRGALCDDRQLGAWMKDGLPRDVVISILDERSRVAVQWRASNATPVRWSHSPLNAKGGSEVAMESLELTVEEFERVQ